jgi:hypothetical protein
MNPLSASMCISNVADQIFAWMEQIMDKMKQLLYPVHFFHKSDSVVDN